MPTYIEGPQDCTGKLLNDEAQGFDFTLITYKAISQTKSRTIGNYWLNALLPGEFHRNLRSRCPAVGSQ